MMTYQRLWRRHRKIPAKSQMVRQRFAIFARIVLSHLLEGEHLFLLALELLLERRYGLWGHAMESLISPFISK